MKMWIIFLSLELIKKNCLIATKKITISDLFLFIYLFFF